MPKEKWWACERCQKGCDSVYAIDTVRFRGLDDRTVEETYLCSACHKEYERMMKGFMKKEKEKEKE